MKPNKTARLKFVITCCVKKLSQLLVDLFVLEDIHFAARSYNVANILYSAVACGLLYVFRM